MAEGQRCSPLSVRDQLWHRENFNLIPTINELWHDLHVSLSEHCHR